VDWNNDGEPDLVFGEREGHLNLYTGNGDGTLHFIGHIFDDASTEIMTNYNSSPWLVDWDEDGKLDLLVTGYLTETTTGGIVRVYPGTGDAPDSPVFEADYLDYTPFYNKWRTTAQTVDLDADGDKDLVLGYEMGEVFFAPNTGSDENPQFSTYSVMQCDGGPINVYTNFQGGGRARENVADYNSDGILDLIVGCSNGWVYVFLGYQTGIEGGSASGALDIDILGNPTTGAFTVDLSAPAGATTDLVVRDSSGRIVEQLCGTSAGIVQCDISSSPAGAYFVTATCNGASTSARLVKI
jgi:hypothetical protein